MNLNSIGTGKLDNDDFPVTKSWHLSPKHLVFVFILAFVIARIFL